MADHLPLRRIPVEHPVVKGRQPEPPVLVLDNGGNEVAIELIQRFKAVGFRVIAEYPARSGGVEVILARPGHDIDLRVVHPFVAEIPVEAQGFPGHVIAVQPILGAEPQRSVQIAGRTERGVQASIHSSKRVGGKGVTEQPVFLRSHPYLVLSIRSEPADNRPSQSLVINFHKAALVQAGIMHASIFCSHPEATAAVHTNGADLVVREGKRIFLIHLVNG